MEEFETEIQPHNFFGNDYLLIKFVALKYHKKYDDRKVFTKNTVYVLIGEFHSYLYNAINQDAPKNVSHNKDTINI